jgi:hypothetical protein
VKPDVLLEQLLGGVLTNVSFADAKRLLEGLGFEELREAATTCSVVQASLSSSTFRTDAAKPSPTNYGGC